MNSNIADTAHLLQVPGCGRPRVVMPNDNPLNVAHVHVLYLELVHPPALKIVFLWETQPQLQSAQHIFIGTSISEKNAELV
jgi:hypothetical protein